MTKLITSLRRDIGLNEFRVRFVEIEQLLRECRELEEVIFFRDRFGGASAIGTVVARLRIIHIQFIEDAVLAGVTAFIDEAVVQAALKQPLHRFVMFRIGGADERSRTCSPSVSH